MTNLRSSLAHRRSTKPRKPKKPDAYSRWVKRCEWLDCELGLAHLRLAHLTNQLIAAHAEIADWRRLAKAAGVSGVKP